MLETATAPVCAEEVNLLTKVLLAPCMSETLKVANGKSLQNHDQYGPFLCCSPRKAVALLYAGVSLKPTVTGRQSLLRGKY